MASEGVDASVLDDPQKIIPLDDAGDAEPEGGWDD